MVTRSYTLADCGLILCHRDVQCGLLMLGYTNAAQVSEQHYGPSIPIEQTPTDTEWKLPPRDELESPILSLVGQPRIFTFLPVEFEFATPVKPSLHIPCLLDMKLKVF